MWLFDTPKDYPEMLKKIAWTCFFIVIIGLILISYLSSDFGEFMSNISFGLKYEANGIKAYISYFYIPLFFAIFENIFKLHDRISDLLGIRFRFDKNIIIKKILEICDRKDIIQRVNRKNRDKIMSNIFYKYAGYGEPCIDIHLIYMALGSWSWYWIILDTILITLILGVIYLALSFSWIRLIVFISIILFFSIINYLIKNFLCIQYATLEVESILEDKKRKKEITNYICHINN